VLELASEGDPTRITVSALADRAGVHRSTVYEHAGSPVELLYGALRDELDALRRERLEGIPAEAVAAAVREVTLDVVEHVERHAAVYCRLEESSGATLHAFLGEHFRASSRLLLDQGSLAVPVATSGVPREVAEEAAIRFVADGTVGVLAAWIRSPEPRDAEGIAQLIAELLPAWWPRLDS